MITKAHPGTQSDITIMYHGSDSTLDVLQERIAELMILQAREEEVNVGSREKPFYRFERWLQSKVLLVDFIGAKDIQVDLMGVSRALGESFTWQALACAVERFEDDGDGSLVWRVAYQVEEI